MPSSNKNVRHSEEKDLLALSAMALAHRMEGDVSLAIEDEKSRAPAKLGLNLRLGTTRVFVDMFEKDDGEAGKLAPALLKLLAEDETNPEPALSLAICAARLDRMDEARIFALEAIRRGGKYPRAYCILGMSALERGERDQAQAHLAAAARLARTKAEFRADLRAAQRLLLILHFGGPRRLSQEKSVKEEKSDDRF